MNPLIVTLEKLFDVRDVELPETITEDIFVTSYDKLVANHPELFHIGTESIDDKVQSLLHDLRDSQDTAVGYFIIQEKTMELMQQLIQHNGKDHPMMEVLKGLIVSDLQGKLNPDMDKTDKLINQINTVIFELQSLTETTLAALFYLHVYIEEYVALPKETLSDIFKEFLGYKL